MDISFYLPILGVVPDLGPTAFPGRPPCARQFSPEVALYQNLKVFISVTHNLVLAPWKEKISELKSEKFDQCWRVYS